MILYSLENLAQSYNGRTVLDIDALTFYRREIYALLGANGAGKTTLFNILAFLEKPAGGRLKFQGQEVRFTTGTMQRLRREVVMVDQHPILFSTSVYKNIEFGLKVRKVPTSERRRIIDEVLEMVDLRAFKHEPALGLSGGETQRVALARALALSPKVFLCDEPTSSVDVENQAAIGGLLRLINEEKGITILFTTHDRMQAAALAHHTVVLEKGRLASTTYENVFSCDLKKIGPGGMVRCYLQNKVLVNLPAAAVNNQHGKQRIYLDPEKIAFGGVSERTEQKGLLQGKVIMLMEEGERIRIMVNIGVMVAVVVSRNRYLQKQPVIGDNLKLRFGADAITILDTGSQ